MSSTQAPTPEPAPATEAPRAAGPDTGRAPRPAAPGDRIDSAASSLLLALIRQSMARPAPRA